MRIKRKNGLKMIVIALVLLLCLALAVGITGAYYQAKRQATGTLNMDQGIVIDYNGFDKTAADDWATWTRGVTLPLFETKDAQPGEHIAVNAAGIRANTESVDFYARVKLSYKFYNVVKATEEGGKDTETEVTLANASDLITTSANFFGTNWVDGGSSDGYYYYATGTTLNKFNKDTQTFVDLFATEAEFVIEGENFTGATSDGEGGGFKIDETTSINKIEVYLTLETLQGDADAAAEGWKIASQVKFAEATGKMETSVNKTETTEDLNVSVAGATEVPINEVVFPYDTDTTLKFDSNNVEYVTLTYEDGSSDTFEEVAEKTISVRANSSKGKVTGYVVGLWSDSEYTGFTFSTKNWYPDEDGASAIYYDVDGLVVTGYFGDNNGNSILTIPEQQKTRKRDYKIKFDYNDYNDWEEKLGSIFGSLQYPCKIDNVEFSSAGALMEYVMVGDCKTDKATAGTTIIVYNTLCETTSVIYSTKDVVEIGSNAFYGSQFSSYELSNKIKKIGSSAFADSELETINIPSSVTEIMGYAFQNCNSLKQVNLSEGLIKIGEMAFSYCPLLESISIPSTINFIGYGLFDGASGGSALLTVEFKSVNPPVINRPEGQINIFRDCNKLTKVYIPTGSLNSYQIAENWNEYSSLFEEKDFS